MRINSGFSALLSPGPKCVNNEKRASRVIINTFRPGISHSLQSEMRGVIPILTTNRERTTIDLKVQELRKRQEKPEDNARNVRRRNGNGKKPIPQTPQTRRQRPVGMPQLTTWQPPKIQAHVGFVARKRTGQAGASSGTAARDTMSNKVSSW